MVVNVLLKAQVSVIINSDDTAEDIQAKINIEAEKIARETGTKVFMTYAKYEIINIKKQHE